MLMQLVNGLKTYDNETPWGYRISKILGLSLPVYKDFET
jgi:hypothetical protein